MFPELDPAGTLPTLLVISASALTGRPAGEWQDLRATASRHRISVAIVGLTPESDGQKLAPFTGGAKIPVSTGGTGHGLWVSATDSSKPGFELRGLRLALGGDTACHLNCPRDLPVEVLANVGPEESTSRPAMIRFESGEGTSYLLTHTGETAGKPEASWEFRRSCFGDVAPYFLLLRDAGGARCWGPPAAMANLTIDDPWLTEPYGCLSYPGLLAEMKRERFHATIGFVPWNYDRSSPATVALIKANPQHFSIAVHGNNHDRYEFFRYERQPGDNQRAKPLVEQARNIRQAMARMEAFQQTTGLAFDRVMVFPHGVCPGPTLTVLKRQGFWVTSNYSNVPLGERPPADPAVALRAANEEWDGFPALRRNYPQNLSEEAIAIDLFLGNPVLVMAHQDLFFDGIDAFNAFAHRVNVRQPAVRWLSLGEISRRLHLSRWLDERSCDVRLMARHAQIENPRADAVVFRFTKREPSSETVARVTLDGVELPWTFAAGAVHFSASLPARASGLIELHYAFPAETTPVDLQRRGFRNRTLRLIAEFRDLALSRSLVGKILTRKYYRQGKRRPTISGLFSRLTGFLRVNRPGSSGPGRA